MRILIADDSAIVRERLAHLLSEVEGVQVIGHARDGVEARELARKLKPDVAILDLRMPMISGADLLREMKRLTPAPTVIMLTNYAHPENRKRCIDGGADYFFDKSTEFRKVLLVLGGMLRGAADAPGQPNS